MNDRIGILKINQKKLNLSGFSDIEKSYQEGIYSDTPANRKLGRVGMSYKQYSDKLNKDNNTDEKISSTFNDFVEKYKMKKNGDKYTKKYKFDSKNGFSITLNKKEAILKVAHRKPAIKFRYDRKSNSFLSTNSYIKNVSLTDTLEGANRASKFSSFLEKNKNFKDKLTPYDNNNNIYHSSYMNYEDLIMNPGGKRMSITNEMSSEDFKHSIKQSISFDLNKNGIPENINVLMHFKSDNNSINKELKFKDLDKFESYINSNKNSFNKQGLTDFEGTNSHNNSKINNYIIKKTSKMINNNK